MNLDLNLSQEQRIAISELLSIVMLPLSRSALDGPPEVPSDIASNIHNRIRDLLVLAFGGFQYSGLPVRIEKS
jgi:hypothetical protein